MNQRTALGLAALAAALILPSHVSAQSITGYSAIQEAWSCPPTTVPAPPVKPQTLRNSEPSPDIGRVCTPQIGAYNFNAQVYSQTAEDYNSALYYNVQTATGEYYGISNNPVVSQVTAPTNGTASTQLNYYYPNANVDGIYSETTTHALNFYYVTAGGQYYDPYGYSTYTNGQTDGSYGDGYWFYVNVAAYIAQATIVLGQTIGVLNHNSVHTGNTNTPSARSYSVALQTFIPGQNAQAPYSPPPFAGRLLLWASLSAIFRVIIGILCRLWVAIELFSKSLLV